MNEKKVTAKAEEIKEKVENNVKEIAEGAKEKAEEAKKAVKETVEEVKEKAADAKEAAADKVEEVKKEGEEAAEKVSEKAKEVAEKVSDKATEVSDKVKEKVAEVTETVEEEVVEVKDAHDTEGVLAIIEASQAPEDVKAETLCRWGAARAGVIVVAPLLGTVALMANEVYMVSRIAKVYDKKITEGAAAGFIAAISATIAGNLLTTLIPIGVVQIPIAVGLTYAVGKAAQAWIKDDMPKDMAPYVEILKEWKEKATKEAKVFAEDPLKNIPLGDESKKELKNTGEKVKNLVDDLKGKAEEALVTGKDKVQETAQAIKTKTQETVVDVASKIEDAAGATKEKINEKIEKVEEAVEEVEEKVEKAVDDAKENK